MKKFSQAADSFNSQYEKLRQEYELYLKDIDLDFNKIINVIIDKTSLEVKNDSLIDSIAEIDKLLNSEETKCLIPKLNFIEAEIKDLQGKLDEPTKKYEIYLDKLKEWKNKEDGLVGSELKEGTIKFYEKILEYLDTKLDDELIDRRTDRSEKVRQLYQKKQEIISIYRELYQPVTKFIDANKDLKKIYPIKFDVSLQIKDFEDKFFRYVNQGTRGTFYGKEDGLTTLRDLLLNTDFNNNEGVVKILNEIMFYLESDKRKDQNNQRREIQSQIKKGLYLEFYNFLFDLDYLIPTYQLKLSEKDISELSPGERGALLLIFYLMLDQDNIPLVIDQPEENLDNQSVYKILVQFIKTVKERRQIIIVTHNPNLAVVCDAEQIINVAIDKTNNNKYSFYSGAIENPLINQRIVDILEGTMPAFNMRERKYALSKEQNIDSN